MDEKFFKRYKEDDSFQSRVDDVWDILYNLETNQKLCVVEKLWKAGYFDE